MINKKQLDKLMWEYSKEEGSDNIVGLHVCDNFMKWMASKLIRVALNNKTRR